MRNPIVFLVGVLAGAGIATAMAQTERLPGDNYVNHIAISVPNFDEAFAF